MSVRAHLCVLREVSKEGIKILGAGAWLWPLEGRAGDGRAGEYKWLVSQP